MKKTTKAMVLAAPCPLRTKKRPMSRTLGMLKLAFLLFLLTASISSKAQSYTLKGKVTDSQGQPLPGATLTETTKKSNTQTRNDGSFTLNTSTTTGTIIVRYLGYQPKTLSYNINTALNISLDEDANTLKAVEINTGYYSVQQKQLTGNISTLKAADIEKQPITNPLTALQGRTTGAQVSQSSGIPGAPVTILIRGTGSLDAGTQPLYLVDGVPFGAQSLSSTQTTPNYGAAGASPFSSIAPEDIESISILKDADATAIYGSRGANGVVLITTKKGSQGKLKIDLNSYYGTSSMANNIDMLGTQAYLETRRAAFAADNTTVKATDYDLNGTWDPTRQTHWQKELLGNAASFDNQRIALSAGSPAQSFQLSATRQQQGSINSSGDRYAKYAIALSASQSSADQKLQVTASANYSADRNQWTNSDLLSRAINLSPNAPALRNPDGSLNWAGSSWTNPLRNFENPYNAKGSNLIANLSASYSPIQNLKPAISVGYTQSSMDDFNYTPASYYDPAQNTGPASSALFTNTASSSSLIAEPQLSYSLDSKRFGNFSFLAGYSIQQLQRQQIAMSGIGFASDALIENLQAATTVQVRANSQTTYRYSGLYGRIGYGYQGRYILNLTARRDGTSRFGSHRRQANFGAIGAAYLLSETRFIKEKFPIISLLKLRASYGSAGNDQIGDYEFLNTYQSQNGYNGSPGLSPVRLYNPELAWERTNKGEIGIELGLWNDRFRFSVSHYRNRSASQLVNYPLPGTTGFASIRSNLDARLQNTGTELEASYSGKLGRISFQTAINYTIPRSKLLEFPGLASSTYNTRYAIGQPLNIGKTYQLLGVDPTSGLYTFRDYNGDGTITSADRQMIVQRGQSGYGGWNNQLSYQNFELSFLIQVVFQRSTTFRGGLSSAPGRMANLPLADQGKYWTQPGDIATFQRLTSGANSAALTAFANYQLSDAATGDASFARLKNLSLSYRNGKLLPGKTLRCYFQGQNLYTVTNYFGIDPEQPALSTPPLRTLTFGLQLIL